MAMTAYVFIDCTDDAAKVLLRVRRIRGVKAAHALFGELDVIATVECESLKELERVIVAMHGVEGVGFTDTRIARDR